jgi:3-oxoacyl-[acyl-carrier-protein] synthase II
MILPMPPSSGPETDPQEKECSMNHASAAHDGPPPIRPHRVVITGLGAISSLAANAPETWDRMLAGQTGIQRIDDLDPDQYASRVRGDVADKNIANRFLDRKVARNTSRFSRMAIEAAGEALIDAGLLDEELQPTIDLGDAGAALGSCVGGTYDDLLPAYDTLTNRGTSRIPPHLHVMFPHNLAAYTIQSRFGMHGPSSTVVTACATGSQAIGDGYEAIRYGKAPLMIAGAVESTYHPLFTAGFLAMKALVTDSNDQPERASRPFDASRAGFVLGEGAAMLVLEELEHAKARGARIYAEILGFATSNDAYHPIAPQPEGLGAERAIRAALAEGGISPDEIDHVNAHAASTPAGDLAEAKAIHRVFGDRTGEIPVTSVTGAIGHCMAAAGALETIAAVRTIADGVIPPTLNYETPDPEIDLDIVHGEPRQHQVHMMTKHSFGLGGQNAVLVLGRYDERI